MTSYMLASGLAHRLSASRIAEQLDCAVRRLLLDEAVRIDDAERVLPGVETADLADDGLLEVDVEAGEDRVALLLVHVAVLRADRVDRRRVHVDPAEGHGPRCVFSGAEHG